MHKPESNRRKQDDRGRRKVRPGLTGQAVAEHEADVPRDAAGGRLVRPALRRWAAVRSAQLQVARAGGALERKVARRRAADERARELSRANDELEEARKA